jgi:hypothetical protein
MVANRGCSGSLYRISAQRSLWTRVKYAHTMIRGLRGRMRPRRVNQTRATKPPGALAGPVHRNMRLVRALDSSCCSSSSLSSTELPAILVLRVPYSHDVCQATQAAWCPCVEAREFTARSIGIEFLDTAVAYLSPADNSHGFLLGRLKGAHQPVIKPRNRFSASRSSLLAGL